MKKELLRIGILCSIVGFTLSANAQEYIDKKITEKNGNISLVTFKSNAGLKETSKAELFKNILKISQDTELRLKKSENDFTKTFLDEKYQQYYKGVVIEFGTYNLHYKKGQLTSMNGELFPTDNVNTTPSISAESAFQRAVESVSARKYMWDEGYGDVDYNKKPTGELVLFPIQQSNETFVLKLAYKFDIFAAEPISRAYIYVDAANGKVLFSDAIMKHTAATSREKGLNSEITEAKKELKDDALKNTVAKLATGSADTRYSGTKSIETSTSGSNYILNDTTRGGGVRTYNIKNSTSTGSAVDFTDNDNNWTTAEFDNAAYDNAALDVHWGIEMTYDYWKQKFNRNSYNNQGTQIRSYVHYSTSYENAAWSGSYMIYGDGATTFRPLVSLDVTAHELGHGVCAAVVGLAYQRESGAMNEGFSDIWGATVENFAAPEKQNFLMGEDITKVKPYYLRSMSNPKDVGQPDTYRGSMWQAATAAEGCTTPDRDANDYCGVHTNSGVLNHWYYILVQGKTGTNDIGSSYNVTGIGYDKAAQITFRLESVYLTANSTYINARDLGIQAAIDLYGANSPEAIATQDAFYAVGLGARYSPADTIAPSTPIDLVANSTTNVSTYLNWTASTDNFAVDSYDVYRDNVLVGNSKTNAYYAKGLTAATTYKFKVQAKDVAGNKSDFSNELSVTTANSGLTYCDSHGTNTGTVQIQRVQLNTLDNSGNSNDGYEDYSYLSTDLEKGQTYTITLTPTFGTLPARAVRYRVYIDYNNNGVFTDSGEDAWTQSTATSATPVTGTFTVPTTAIVGQVRMRIAVAYGSTPTSCSTIANGQVEDYSVNLKNFLAVSDVNSVSQTVIYPNPVKDILNIKSAENGELTYRIYNAAGQSVANGKSADNKIDVNRLSTGNYVIELVNKKGEKSTQKFIKK